MASTLSFRRTLIRFFPTPVRVAADRATLEVALEPRQHTSVFVTVSCTEGDPAPIRDFFISYRDTHRARPAATEKTVTLECNNELFSDVGARAVGPVVD